MRHTRLQKWTTDGRLCSVMPANESAIMTTIKAADCTTKSREFKVSEDMHWDDDHASQDTSTFVLLFPETVRIAKMSNKHVWNRLLPCPCMGIPTGKQFDDICMHLPRCPQDRQTSNKTRVLSNKKSEHMSQQANLFKSTKNQKETAEANHDDRWITRWGEPTVAAP